jgi:cell division septation protein DedD
MEKWRHRGARLESEGAMRQNSRIRERFELSLDGKQVASIVVGALVVLGAVFVLGLNVGRQLAAGSAPPRPENPLAALDRAPVPPAGEKEPRLSFHDALTKGPPETAPIPEAKPKVDPGSRAVGTALNTLPPAPTPAPADRAPAPAAAPARAPAPKKPLPAKDPMASAVAKVSSLPAEGAAPGRFAVQVGATQNEAEAERLQRKLASEGARVVVADVPGKGRWYRIQLGSYASRAEAEQRRAALAAQGVKGFVAQGR